MNRYSSVEHTLTTVGELKPATFKIHCNISKKVKNIIVKNKFMKI